MCDQNVVCKEAWSRHLHAWELSEHACTNPNPTKAHDTGPEATAASIATRGEDDATWARGHGACEILCL